MREDHRFRELGLGRAFEGAAMAGHRMGFKMVPGVEAAPGELHGVRELCLQNTPLIQIKRRRLQEMLELSGVGVIKFFRHIRRAMDGFEGIDLDTGSGAGAVFLRL
jgi:hypothetical protein